MGVNDEWNFTDYYNVEAQKDESVSHKILIG